MTRTGNFKEALTTLERGLQIANDMFRSYCPMQIVPGFALN